MKKILLIGAGRSTISLIDYLLENLEKENWTLLVGDQNIDFAKSKIGDHSRASAIAFDVTDDEQREQEISDSDIVISMLPAHMHVSVAKDCIRFKKNMVTASYVSKEMRALEQDAIANGVTIINEIGVDPGIDHMSAMKVIDEIRGKGGKIEEFETFTGGLIAPESDDNPWNYKFTWNPRNVVLAGQGGAVKFIQSGTYKYIPYHKLFRRTEIIDVEGYGKFEGYANRDSLMYRSVYQLEDIKTMYRGTLRRPGFSRAWNVFVQLGATDDSYQIENSDQMTFRDFINLFLAYNPNDSVELKLKHYLNMHQDDVELFDKLEWLDIFKSIRIPLKNASPAQILQYILERKWSLSKEDKDMIVMWHKFVYELDGSIHELHSSMVVKGEDSLRTAMAKTVGYPVAIAAKMLLKGVIDRPGIQIPIAREIYEPVLSELRRYGVDFKEKLIQ
ncbi:saccharopine dehydrogenase family protein [Acidiluteibacter ferrifornacis]|uniref:Saccharopine dehydrogenase n=1 Tax=Acidiluteibacter ferrifornacis TaxID=2692424 RepID=A0A6N9NIX0_9FLAO|nr:saccharopine dehydrogenase C-terminal domain-containing protein [Acidiluteibacter ferrifornacis]NBG65799.1 saccharopine dehydrogenase [Acidiluteibacter ferrifornacis]